MTLRQWLPESRRKLRVYGHYPLIVCGSGNSQFNWVQRSLGVPKKGPLGGNISLSVWTLGVLYEQYQLGRNRWSRKNTDLDLVLYHGAHLRFWRDPTTDYVVFFDRNQPTKLNLLSYQSSHPALLLLQKYKIVVKSKKTKPRGKPWKSAFIRPPRMLTHKFYFQHDFCNVNLFSIKASACSLENSWVYSEETTPCITFFVLRNAMYPRQGIANVQYEQNMSYTWGIKQENVKMRQHFFRTNFQPFWRDFRADDNVAWSLNNVINPAKYKQFDTTLTNKQTAELAAIKQLATDLGLNITTTEKSFLHNFGMYSAFLLNPNTKVIQQTSDVYESIRYSPLADRGIGNFIAVQPISTQQPQLDQAGTKYIVKDLPLWLGFYGYFDYISKVEKASDFFDSYRCFIRCPYTNAQLISTTNNNQGFTFYGYNFATGRMPGAEEYIPVDFRAKWYPTIRHQLEVSEQIVNCGPFMPRDKRQLSWEATMSYKFKFTLGGTLPPPQEPGDPCEQPTSELPDPSILSGAVQVTDPQFMDPGRLLHRWSWRRGFLTKSGFERVSEYSPADESLFAGDAPPPKRPKNDVPIQEEGVGSGSFAVLQQMLQTPQRPELEDQEDRAQGQAVPSPRVQLLRELEHQREYQEKLRSGLGVLVQQLMKTQAGLQVHPGLL